MKCDTFSLLLSVDESITPVPPPRSINKVVKSGIAQVTVYFPLFNNHWPVSVSVMLPFPFSGWRFNWLSCRYHKQHRWVQAAWLFCDKYLKYLFTSKSFCVFLVHCDFVFFFHRISEHCRLTASQTRGWTNGQFNCVSFHSPPTFLLFSADSRLQIKSKEASVTW